MDIASYSQVYPHGLIDIHGFVFADVASFGYSILGTVCCIGLFIMVLVAIIFSVVLYRRRRYVHILAMRAMMRQQAPFQYNQDESPSARYDPDELHPYGVGTYGPLFADETFKHPKADEDIILPINAGPGKVSGQSQQGIGSRPQTGAFAPDANLNAGISANLSNPFPRNPASPNWSNPNPANNSNLNWSNSAPANNAGANWSNPNPAANSGATNQNSGSGSGNNAHTGDGNGNGNGSGSNAA
jgi:uncharacterized membrane protein YgcG